jgi:peptide chain release factor subunit 1
MISHADVEKLLGIQAADRSVLSVYLRVPVDPPALRGLQARVDELLALAGGSGDGPGAARARDEDRRMVRRMLEIHARDWLGHTVAMFACAQLSVSEAFPLLCRLPERAVLAARPHVRPLLVALQRCPAYRVAVVDRRHAWIFSVAGDRVSVVAQPAAAGVRSPAFGGWYGLESHRVHERIIELARHHYQDTAAVLGQATRSGEPEPLVVGGHEEAIPAFLAVLPADVADHFAGSFVVDPHTMTPARVRELSGAVIRDWADRCEQRLLTQLCQEPPDGLTVTGLHSCLAAVGQHAVKLLVVPVGGLIPGFACTRCGALTSTPGGCGDWPAAARQVPDLIEEMVIDTLRDGGDVAAVPDPPGDIAARARFLLTQAEGKPLSP